MAKSDKTFHLAVITPEASALEADVQAASFTAHDGDIGILPRHAPLICNLGIGQLRYTTDDGEGRMFIDGGIAQIIDNEVTLLTQSAIKCEDIDKSAAEHDLADARAMKIPDHDAFAARQNAMQRAKAKIKLAT